MREIESNGEKNLKTNNKWYITNYGDNKNKYERKRDKKENDSIQFIDLTVDFHCGMHCMVDYGANGT